MASLNLSAPPSAGGAEPALTAAGAGGDSFPLNGPIVIEASANGAGARTITLVAQNACNQGVLHNKAYVVPNDATRHWIYIPASQVDRFRDVNGRVQLTYDSNAGLTIGAHAAQ
jgi:hypothetical protein